MSDVPDYSESFLTAESALRACHAALIDRRDMNQALGHAKDALWAIQMLTVDIAMRQARVRR